jgi:hypothetical protein
MKFYIYISLIVSSVCARTPLDTLAVERSDDGAVSTIDSATFGNWGQQHRIYWTIQPSNPATILGVRGSMEH